MRLINNFKAATGSVLKRRDNAQREFQYRLLSGRNRLAVLTIQLLMVALVVGWFGHRAAAQALQSGVIKGSVIAVTADKREALGGVTIILSRKTLPQKTIQANSDQDGSFAVSELAAGDYVVTIEMAGFEGYAKEVAVAPGATRELTVELKPAGITESVTVASSNDEIGKTESSVPSEITTSVLQNAPLINEKFQDALPLLPGVVRGPDGLLNIKGARSNQSGILVSNVNVDDPVTGNSAIELPIEAVENIQVYSNPYSAEFGKFTGAVTSIETRAGTNEWKYLLTNFLPRLRHRAGATRGIESATPRFTVSGPLLKDKLFLFQSFEYRYVRTRVPSLPDLRNDTKLEAFNSFTRVDYNFNDTNHISATLSVFPQKLDYFNLNTFNPLETAANFHQRGWLFAVNEEAVLRNNSLLQSSFSVKQQDADVFGNSASLFTLAPERNSGGFFDNQHRHSRRYQWLEAYTLPAHQWHGQHSLKFGASISYITFDGTDKSSPVRIARANGTTSQLETFVGDGRLHRDNGEYGGFIQDKWTLNPRVTFDLGLRYDRDGIGKSNNLAPRVGFVISPFQDKRTIIRGGIGLFYDKIPLNVGVFEQYQSALVTAFAGDGKTPLGTSTLFHNAVEKGDLRTPYSVAWNLQVDREVTEKLRVRFGYEERQSHHDFIIDPEDPERLSVNDGLYLLGNEGTSRYREFQLAARYRFQAHHDLFFAYTRSLAAGDLNTLNDYIGNLRSPVIRDNEYSRLPFDAPNRFLSWGDIGLPFKLTATPALDWHTGFPYSLLNEDQNFIGKRNAAGRFPDFFSLDMQVTKGFTVPFRGKEYTARIGVKVFNITNHFNPRDVQNNIASAQPGAFYNSVSRTFRMKLEMDF